MAAACCLLIHLWCAPSILPHIEENYQNKMEYVRSPQEYWVNLRRTIDAIQADPEMMEQIRIHIEAKIAAEEEARAAESE